MKILVAFALMVAACGEAPPPPAKPASTRQVKIHVANGSRYDLCRIESCGQVGRAIDTGSPRIGGGPGQDPPLKPHQAGMYEVRECPASSIAVVACPVPGESTPPCLKAEGGTVQEGTMFRVAACAL